MGGAFARHLLSDGLRRQRVRHRSQTARSTEKARRQAGGCSGRCFGHLPDPRHVAAEHRCRQCGAFSAKAALPTAQSGAPWSSRPARCRWPVKHEIRDRCARTRHRGARLSCQRHRCAGGQPRHRDLRQRRAQGLRRGRSGAEGFLAQRLLLRRIRQRLQAEIRRQPAGDHPQPVDCRSDGDGPEIGPRPGTAVQGDQGRRRHVAHVRGARTADDRQRLPQGTR